MVHTAVQSSLRSKVDPHGRALIRKTSFASRSIRRQKAVKLSPTGRQVRSSSLHPNACRIARLALATHCKQYALCRSLGTISSSRCQTTRNKQALHTKHDPLERICFLFRTSIPSTGRQDHRWWSQTGSNRRPPACKAGALPTELWPRASDSRTWVPSRSGKEWWAWEDLNFRPHAYQARALTN